MKNLSNIVKDYLTKPSTFAIQMVGNWGVGKTFHYKNTIEDLIASTETLLDARKKYKPLYISLFGLKSVDEVATKIISSFFDKQHFGKYFNTNGLSITQSIFRIGLRGFLNFSMLGQLKDYQPDLRKVGQKVLDSNELVICFDDLERKDSSFTIEDLSGYINSLVDEGIKVIIISNEDMMLKNDESYKNLKEKIIGITVEYTPNARDVLQNIIATTYVQFPVYFEFLKNHLELVYKISAAVDYNFRHITYALSVLHNCHSLIKDRILDTEHEIGIKVQEEITNIVTFILIMAIEYKSSALKHSDSSEYEDRYITIKELMSSSFKGNQPINENKPNRFERLITKYKISKDVYRYYQSAFDYITGYSEFDIEQFINEFKTKFRLEKGKVLPQQELLKDLAYDHCLDLTDNVYKEKTLLVIGFAEKGLYLPAEYLTVMYYTERFDNIFAFDLADVKRKLMTGLLKAFQETPLTSTSSFHQFEMSKSSEMSALTLELYEFGIHEIKAFKERRIRTRVDSIATSFITNLAEFEDKYNSDTEFKDAVAEHAFLSIVSPEELFSMVKNIRSREIMFLRYFLKERYQNSNVLKDEFQNLVKFTRILSEYQVQLGTLEGNKIKHISIGELVDSLTAIEGLNDAMKE